MNYAAFFLPKCARQRALRRLPLIEQIPVRDRAATIRRTDTGWRYDVADPSGRLLP